MKLNNINKETNKLPVEQQEAILSLIDQKIENDMEKVIAKIEQSESKFENSLNGLSSALKQSENSFKNENKLIHSEFKNTNNRINTILWVIGIAMAIITIMLTILAFKK